MTDNTEPTIDTLKANILTEFKQVLKLAPADYTENCTNVVMSLVDEYVADQVAKAIEQSKPLYTKQRIAKGVCKYGHIGQYTKSVKGFNYCKQCHHEQDRRCYLKRKALKGVKNK